jgi:2-polyprenyl-6-methoxyphenol hydroxylase-like FAD-dependent oxidoreductase
MLLPVRPFPGGKSRPTADGMSVVVTGKRGIYMRSVIVGAGPTGLYTAIALARRGHQVTVIDRDAGPDGGQRWDRKGVMQFHHPHFFRQQVADALLAEMPEVWRGLLAAGAVPAELPGQPGVPAGLHCRRVTFERVLRAAARDEPWVRLRVGHVDAVCGERGRVTGVRAGGLLVDADLVIDAGGRGGRLTRALRGPAEGGDCGIAYVSRQYQMRPGAAPGPVNMPFGVMMTYPGYVAAAFIHDNRIISALIARASTDRQLAALRTRAAFDAAARAIPALAAWTDPGQSRPITPVLPGGRLYNSYRGQLDDAGRVALAGLIYVGDSVCTTNPAAGRGVTTSLLQARQLIALLGEHGCDLIACSLAFDHWCADHIRPWFDDHVYWDADLIRRWSGRDVDLARPLPPDLIIAAAQADPEIAKAAAPYQAMLAPPARLDAVQARARDIYATGWRPPTPPGPTRDELAALVTAATSSRSHPTRDAALPAAAARPCPGRRPGLLRESVRNVVEGIHGEGVKEPQRRRPGIADSVLGLARDVHGRSGRYGVTGAVEGDGSVALDDVIDFRGCMAVQSQPAACIEVGDACGQCLGRGGAGAEQRAEPQDALGCVVPGLAGDVMFAYDQWLQLSHELTPF